MTGRTVMIGFLAFTILFGVALWWFQTRAFYEETEAQSVEIAGEVFEATATPSSSSGRKPWYAEETVIEPE